MQYNILRRLCQVYNARSSNSAETSLSGNDLLAYKVAYQAAVREFNFIADRYGGRPGLTISLGPGVPKKRLMMKTPTGDYVFTFLMRGISPQQLIQVQVMDLGNSLSAGSPMLSSCSDEEFLKKFGPVEGVGIDWSAKCGETEGVKADANSIRKQQGSPDPNAQQSAVGGTTQNTALWEGKVVQGDVRSNVYFIHKGIRYYVDKWDYVTPFGLWGDRRMLKVKQGEVDALPEGHAIDSIDEMKRCLAR